MSDFSRNMKRLRISKDLSQAELAERIGVSRQTISSWERSSSFPDIEMVQKLVVTLDANYNDLLYPSSHRGVKTKSNRPLSGRFICYSVTIFLFFFFVIGPNFIVPILKRLFGGDISTDLSYLICWGIILLVIYIAVVAGILSEYITENAIEKNYSEKE